MPLSEREGWLTLAAAEGVGPRTALALVRAFGGAAAAARARPRDVARLGIRLAGVSAARVAEALAVADPRPLVAAAERAGQTLLTPADDDYPRRIAETHDPPPALFVRGRLPSPDRVAVGVVGTRDASRYGARVARSLGEALARAGTVVVSGLARGIDAAAHWGALAGGGETVAVLGCGADVAYPSDHGELLAEVAAHGAAITEHPPGTSPRADHFPRRNRLIAALSRAVVVVEAPGKSGALLTATLANESGREVLAVPGPVDRGTHVGCHRLLRQGAALCEGVNDVLSALKLEPVGVGAARGEDPASPPDAGPPLVVWRALDRDEALDIDAIADRTGLSADAVAVALTLLEVDGRVERVPGVGFLRS